MKMKVIACLLFFLNTVLFATYYAISKEALGRIDPIIFSFFEMVSLAPVAILILLATRHSLTRDILKRGVLLGSWLCLALFTIAIALKYTSATSTAFFPSLNGLLAAVIAWVFLREPIKKMTWVAGVLSVIGTALLISNSSMGGWRGTLIAFLGGLFFTCYVFLADQQQRPDESPWPLFGVETLTVAAGATLIALLFGDWTAVHPALPKDIIIIVYIAGATTFLPILITVLMQKYISPVTVSFIYILEPVLGSLFANLYLHELLPPIGYLGGGLVICGTLIHTWSISRSTVKAPVEPQPAFTAARPQVISISQPRARTSPFTSWYLIVLLCAGFFFLYGLGGFPPHAWRDLYSQWPNLSYLSQHGQNSLVIMLWTQAICWFVAWTALISMALLSVFHVGSRLLFPPKPTIMTFFEEPEEHYLPEVSPATWKIPTSSLKKPAVDKSLSLQQRRKERLQRLRSYTTINLEEVRELERAEMQELISEKEFTELLE